MEYRVISRYWLIMRKSPRIPSLRGKSYEFEDDTQSHRVTTTEARRTEILWEQPLSTFRVHPHKTGNLQRGKMKKYIYTSQVKTKNTKQITRPTKEPRVIDTQAAAKVYARRRDLQIKTVPSKRKTN